MSYKIAWHNRVCYNAGMDTYIGQQLGNYLIDKCLARGSFGEVYLAHHRYITRLAAIKFLHAHYCSSDEQRQEFMQEAQLLEYLKHEHILPLYDVSADQEGFPPYLISAYAQGGSLRERMRQQRDGFALEEALTILEQIGQALQHAHDQPQPVIHRDLKPENILFDEAGRALLADFGIAVVLDTSTSQQVGTAGTVPYMAPEQFGGKVSSKSDQYALGCLAYELITGRRPIQAQNQGVLGWMFQHIHTLPQPLSHWRPDLPLHIDVAILKTLAKDPHERHADVESFLRALRTAPHDPMRYQALLAAQLQAAQKEQTQQHYEQALALSTFAARIDSSDTRPLKGQGEALLALNRSQEALAVYTQILRLAPNDPVALTHSERLRQPKPPTITTPPTPALTPAQMTALSYKATGDTQARQQHYPEAWSAYEQALQSDPCVSLDWCLFGETCWHQAYYEQALIAYDQALQQQPQRAEAWMGRAHVLHSLRRNAEALDAYAQAACYGPGNAAAHYGRGLILAEQERYDDALTAYEQALQCQPDFVLAHCAKGDTLYNNRLYRPALAAYEQALHYASTYADAWYGKADVLLKLKQAREAREAYTLALQYDAPSSARSLRQADALFLLARYPEALETYKQLLQADDANPDLYERCGDIYRQLGQKREADVSYQRADQLRGYV